MYMTIEKARAAAKEYVGKWPVPPVIVERKLSKCAKWTFYGFNFLITGKFDPEWKQDEDHRGHYIRMVEVVK